VFLFQASEETGVAESTGGPDRFGQIIDLLEVIGPVLLLPIGILWLTNRHTRSLSREEHERRLEADSANRLANVKDSDSSSLLDRNKRVIAAMYQLLTVLQLRHVQAQCVGTTDPSSCMGIDNSGLQEAIVDAQEIFSSEFLFIGSKMIDQIYTLLARITELMVDLVELEASDAMEKASIEQVLIYEAAESCADVIAAVHESLVAEQIKANKGRRELLVREFSAKQIDNMRGCCGVTPSAAQRARADQFKQRAERRADHEIRAIAQQQVRSPSA